MGFGGGMRTRRIGARALLATALAAFCAPLARADPISFVDLLSRPRPAPTRRIAYGPSPLQFGQMWSPGGQGLHPVVVMIHGGCCWTACRGWS